jgi:hypothetical protein
MLTTLLMGNRDLLEHSITPSTIAKFVELIRLQPENDRFLKLLCALCTCDGNPVPCNQEAITDVLVKDPVARNELLVAIRVNEITGVLEVLDCCRVSAACVSKGGGGGSASWGAPPCLDIVYPVPCQHIPLVRTPLNAHVHLGATTFFLTQINMLDDSLDGSSWEPLQKLLTSRVEVEEPQIGLAYHATPMTRQPSPGTNSHRQSVFDFDPTMPTTPEASSFPFRGGA